MWKLVTRRNQSSTIWISILSFLVSWTTSLPICPSGNCCPYYDPQTQQCYDHDPNDTRPSSTHSPIPRGGSTIPLPLPHDDDSQIVSDQDDDEEEEEPIDYDSISIALRMTCELNRQLLYGTNGMTCAGGHTEQVDHIDFPDSSQTWFHSIQPPSTSTSTSTTPGGSYEPLTIFHAKSPRTLTSSKKKRKLRLKTGCARWGPSLSLYLRQLHSTLQCPPIAFALALIYLDRACSAETQRVSNGQDGGMACPHLTPRTVHRLVLTAMVIASKAMDANSSMTASHMSEKYSNLVRTFGISENAMLNMEAWMLQALGEKGTWVDADRMRNLQTVWQCAFSSSSNSNTNTNTNTNTNNEEEGGIHQYCGIGLQKELERLYPAIHNTVPEIPQTMPPQHSQHSHSQWQESSMATPRVVHIRREQHIVHVQRPTNEYYHQEQPQYPTPPTHEYTSPPPHQPPQSAGIPNTPPQSPPPQHQRHHQHQHQQPSDYLGPSGGYLQEESDSNSMEYYARA